MTASYVIPVRQASALPAASFRFHLAVDTLAVKLVVPPTGPTGDFHFLYVTSTVSPRNYATAHKACPEGLERYDYGQPRLR